MTREFPTWVEIDLDVLRQNLEAIRGTLDGQKILLVVKADAYGHGAVEVAREALAAGSRCSGWRPHEDRAPAGRSSPRRFSS
jgi:alanine racemase